MLKLAMGIIGTFIFSGGEGCLLMSTMARSNARSGATADNTSYLSCLFSSFFPSSKLFLFEVSLLLVPLSPLRPDYFIFFFLFSLVRQVYPLTPLLYQSLPRPTHAWLMPHYRQLISSSHYLFLSSFLFSAYSSAFFVSPSFMFLFSLEVGYRAFN